MLWLLLCARSVIAIYVWPQHLVLQYGDPPQEGPKLPSAPSVAPPGLLSAAVGEPPPEEGGGVGEGPLPPAGPPKEAIMGTAGGSESSAPAAGGGRGEKAPPPPPWWELGPDEAPSLWEWLTW